MHAIRFLFPNKYLNAFKFLIHTNHIQTIILDAFVKKKQKIVPLSAIHSPLYINSSFGSFKITLK